MTDTSIVDGEGAFVAGKAQTTPQDESVGLISSAEDAMRRWDSTAQEAFPRIGAGFELRVMATRSAGSAASRSRPARRAPARGAAAAAR